MARVGFLIDFMIALLRVRTANMSEMAAALSGKAKAESKYKRLQRFMRLHKIDFNLFAVFLSRLIPSDGDAWLLTLDRTNWKFGKVDINILILAVAYKGVAFPLLWEFLPKQGNSNIEERISLISGFVEIFGIERIQFLTADREFIGLNWLNENKIPFCIRIRENISVSSSSGKKVKVKEHFKGLKKGRTRVIRDQSKFCGATLYIVGLKINPKTWCYPEMVDTELSRKNKVVLLMRAFVVYKRMPSFSVIKNLDVIKQTLHSLSPVLVTVMVDPFTLQATKEAFGNSIVVAVAFTAHAAEYSMIVEQFLVVLRCILTAAVCMVDQTL